MQFIRFGFVGVSNFLIAYGTYALLTLIGIPYLISNIVSFFISVLNSFFWNNKYVFIKRKNEYRNAFNTLIKTFITYGTTGLVISNILLLIFVDLLTLNKYIAPIIIYMFTIPFNFILNKFWAFHTTKTEE